MNEWLNAFGSGRLNLVWRRYTISSFGIFNFRSCLMASEVITISKIQRVDRRRYFQLPILHRNRITRVRWVRNIPEGTSNTRERENESCNVYTVLENMKMLSQYFRFAFHHPHISYREKIVKCAPPSSAYHFNSTQFIHHLNCDFLIFCILVRAN